MLVLLLCRFSIENDSTRCYQGVDKCIYIVSYERMAREDYVLRPAL